MSARCAKTLFLCADDSKTGAVRGIIDGHIILSRKVAAQNHYPAIDLLPSISRLMSTIAQKEHSAAAAKLRGMLSCYQSNQDLLSIGAYKHGTNPELDEAIAHIDRINAFLMQTVDEKMSYDDTVAALLETVR